MADSTSSTSSSTSSSSSISSTMVNGRSVITGLGSGIDVDSIVQQLVTADSGHLYQLQQQQQLAEWKQTAYQSIISDINTFSSKYFDLTSSTSILKQSTFEQYSINSSSSGVSANYTSSATTGSHTIAVNQLATAETLSTTGDLSKNIQGTTAVDYSSLAGTSFQVTLDGTQTTVNLDSSVTDLTSLQTEINNAVGTGKLTVSANSSGILSIAPASDSGVQDVSISDPSGSTATSSLTALGFGTGATLSNRIDTSDTLETLAGSMNNSFSFNSDGQLDLTINGVNFSFDQSTTLEDMMSEINQSSAGVTMQYNDLTDQLTLASNTTGAQQSLTTSETGSTFLAAALGTTTAGTDAKVTIDGQDLTRSSNTITDNGIVYTLNQTTASGSDDTVTVTQDVNAIYNTISSFISDYNTLIGTINGQLTAQYNQNYQPLTSAQESQMTDTQISQWNTQAQTGLLQNDSTLESFLSDIRSALESPVSGQSMTLASIGITEGSWTENGTLYIDQDTLQQAIQNNPQGVMNLFTQASTSYPGSEAERTLTSSQLDTRYSQEGISNRFYDDLQKYVSTIPDNNNNEGLLLQIAGEPNDLSATNNQLTTQINNYATQITTEQTRLNNEEDALYTKYNNMDSEISEMDSQLSELQSYFSTSSSS